MRSAVQSVLSYLLQVPQGPIMRERVSWPGAGQLTTVPLLSRLTGHWTPQSTPVHSHFNTGTELTSQ